MSAGWPLSTFLVLCLLFLCRHLLAIWWTHYMFLMPLDLCVCCPLLALKIKQERLSSSTWVYSGIEEESQSGGRLQWTIGKSTEQRERASFYEGKVEVGCGCFEQKFTGEIWEFRVLAAFHWLQAIKVVAISHWLQVRESILLLLSRKEILISFCWTMHGAMVVVPESSLFIASWLHLEWSFLYSFLHSDPGILSSLFSPLEILFFWHHDCMLYTIIFFSCRKTILLSPLYSHKHFVYTCAQALAIVCFESGNCPHLPTRCGTL